MTANRQQARAPLISPDDLMHPTLYRMPFTHADWVFENKLDGFRALVRKGGRNIELLSRNGRSLAEAFPEVMVTLARLRVDAVLDCELVLADASAHPRFERLRRRALIRRPSWVLDAAHQYPATLCVFDMLVIGQRDVREKPLPFRKAPVAELVEAVPGLP